MTDTNFISFSDSFEPTRNDPAATEDPTTEEPIIIITCRPPKEPTTIAPTTEIRETAEPPTEQPTTTAPATEKPTTTAPTTQKPTIAAPATQKPTCKCIL